MSTNDTYLAVFTGSPSSPRRAEWDALTEEARSARQREGMAGWNAWVEKHRDAIVEMGGPLGKTKRVSGAGVSDVSNEMAVFSVVRAASHEAAARMFEGHPHFTSFPGEAVEVMPILPIPGA